MKSLWNTLNYLSLVKKKKVREGSPSLARPPPDGGGDAEISSAAGYQNVFHWRWCDPARL